jgi:hypothetical protein
VTGEFLLQIATPRSDEGLEHAGIASPRRFPAERIALFSFPRIPPWRFRLWRSVRSESAKQLGRLLEHIRGLVLETVHQKAVAVIVVVEDPPQVLPGRQAPVPLQLGRNRRPVDGYV